MSKIFLILLIVVLSILAFIPIALCVALRHDEFTEIHKDSENEK